MAEQTIEKRDFTKLFEGKDWYGKLKRLTPDPEEKKQFVAFVRSDNFLESMKKASKTEEGRENIVKALKDDEIRKILLSNFDSYTVRWAIGDLFNSPEGQQIMKMVAWPLSIAGGKVVKDVVTAMTTTKLSEEEVMKDFNHYKKKEQEFHATQEDLEWFKKFISKAKFDSVEDMTKLFTILRTQEIREKLNEILKTENGKKQIADMLKSENGRVVLELLMKTPEGMNVVGYMWNMKNGKDMLKENMLDVEGLKTIYTILKCQMSYTDTEQKLKTTPQKK